MVEKIFKGKERGGVLVRRAKPLKTTYLARTSPAGTPKEEERKEKELEKTWGNRTKEGGFFGGKKK